MKPYRGNKVTGFPRLFHIHSLEEKTLGERFRGKVPLGNSVNRTEIFEAK